MDLIVTLIGEFVWTSSCGIVNFCVSSGVSALVVFVAVLGAILASAFYKYKISREHLLPADDDDAILTLIDNDDDEDESAATTLLTYQPSTRSPSSLLRTMNINQYRNDNEEDDEQIFDYMMNDTVDDSEEEIQMESMGNIYHPFNNDNETTIDLLNQLRRQGLPIDDETELELS